MARLVFLVLSCMPILVLYACAGAPQTAMRRGAEPLEYATILHQCLARGSEADLVPHMLKLEDIAFKDKTQKDLGQTSRLYRDKLQAELKLEIIKSQSVMDFTDSIVVSCVLGPREIITNWGDVFEIAPTPCIKGVQVTIEPCVPGKGVTFELGDLYYVGGSWKLYGGFRRK